MKAVVVSEFGGPEKLVLKDVQKPVPAKGEILVRTEFSGVNFIDVYMREGMGIYKKGLPFIPGKEACGIVEDANGNREFSEGDRVAFAMGDSAYAECIAVPAWKAVKIPREIGMKEACASMIQGMTAHYLATSVFELKKGHAALVYAAAGGVGHFLVQIAKLKGAFVIASVSTKEKAERAKELGADEVIIYTEEDVESRVREICGGVHVAYDSVGRDTFEKSLKSLKPRGMLALYGQSSGPVGPIDPQTLNIHGSLFLTRPSLAHYASSAEEVKRRADDIFSWITQGKIKVKIDSVFPLEDAKDAHMRLESRKSMGKILLYLKS